MRVQTNSAVAPQTTRFPYTRNGQNSGPTRAIASGSPAADAGYQRIRSWVAPLASSTTTTTGGSASSAMVTRFTQRSRPVYCMMNANHAGGSAATPSHLASPQRSLSGSDEAPSSRA
ncbi:MAG TPA: hypothetical protein VF486_17345 [Actinomycetes bacterium]